MKYVLIALCLLSMTACSTLHSFDEHTNLDLEDGIVFYRDNWVQREKPEVHVRPADKAAYAPSVLFIPFRVTQQMDNPDILGYSVSRVIWQTWLTMELFPAMEFSNDTIPFRRDRALQLGRYRNADVVIGGFVTHAYNGGTVGDTMLSVQIEAYDTRSGQMIWSLAQGGLIPASRTNDYFLFSTKTRMPSNPMQAIAKVIAADTGTVIQNWIGPPLPDERGFGQRVDEGIRDTLYQERDPVPQPRKLEPVSTPGRTAF